MKFREGRKRLLMALAAAGFLIYLPVFLILSRNLNINASSAPPPYTLELYTAKKDSNGNSFCPSCDMLRSDETISFVRAKLKQTSQINFVLKVHEVNGEGQVVQIDGKTVSPYTMPDILGGGVPSLLIKRNGQLINNGKIPGFGDGNNAEQRKTSYLGKIKSLIQADKDAQNKNDLQVTTKPTTSNTEITQIDLGTQDSVRATLSLPEANLNLGETVPITFQYQSDQLKHTVDRVDIFISDSDGKWHLKCSKWVIQNEGTDKDCASIGRPDQGQGQIKYSWDTKEESSDAGSHTIRVLVWDNVGELPSSGAERDLLATTQIGSNGLVAIFDHSIQLANTINKDAVQANLKYRKEMDARLAQTPQVSFNGPPPGLLRKGDKRKINFKLINIKDPDSVDITASIVTPDNQEHAKNNELVTTGELGYSFNWNTDGTTPGFYIVRLVVKENKQLVIQYDLPIQVIADDVAAKQIYLSPARYLAENGKHLAVINGQVPSIEYAPITFSITTNRLVPITDGYAYIDSTKWIKVEKEDIKDLKFTIKFETNSDPTPTTSSKSYLRTNVAQAATLKDAVSSGWNWFTSDHGWWNSVKVAAAGAIGGMVGGVPGAAIASSMVAGSGYYNSLTNAPPPGDPANIFTGNPTPVVSVGTGFNGLVGALSNLSKNVAGGNPEMELKTRIVWIINFLFAAASALTMLAALWTGLMFIFSMGNEELATNAKRNFLNIIIGLVVLLASFGIIRLLVNVLTGSLSDSGETKNGSIASTYDPSSSDTNSQSTTDKNNPTKQTQTAKTTTAIKNGKKPKVTIADTKATKVVNRQQKTVKKTSFLINLFRANADTVNGDLITIPLSLDEENEEPLEIQFTVDGTAIPNFDYAIYPEDGKLIIPANQTTADIKVALNPNSELDNPADDMTIDIKLTKNDDYDLGDNQAKSIILKAASQTVSCEENNDTSIISRLTNRLTISADNTKKVCKVTKKKQWPKIPHPVTKLGLELHISSKDLEGKHYWGEDSKMPLESDNYKREHQTTFCEGPNRQCPAELEKYYFTEPWGGKTCPEKFKYSVYNKKHVLIVDNKTNWGVVAAILDCGPGGDAQASNRDGIYAGASSEVFSALKIPKNKKDAAFSGNPRDKINQVSVRFVPDSVPVGTITHPIGYMGPIVLDKN